MTNRAGDTITWTSYNKPKKIDYGSDSAEFTYGLDRGRFKQVANAGGTATTIYYVGAHFEKEVQGTLTTYRHHVMAGGQTVATYTNKSDSSEHTRYVHRDHLGSVVVLTDGTSGSVVEEYSFDAFGKRRNLDWTADTSNSLFSASQQTERGYTGHEHLDNVRLIHMNGRVQDPVIGRFLSADPFVPQPLFSQSFNRYSYVLNNPLSLVDPTGFAEDEVVKKCKDHCNFSPDPSPPQPPQDTVVTRSGPPCEPPCTTVGPVGPLGPVGDGSSILTTSTNVVTHWTRGISGRPGLGSVGVRAFEGGSRLSTRAEGSAVSTPVGTSTGPVQGIESSQSDLSQTAQGFRITDQQRELAATEQPRAFWESRHATGDPVSIAALRSLGVDVNLNDTAPVWGEVFDYLFGGTSINNRLQAFSRVYNGQELDIGAVRVRLMNAHVRAVDADLEGVIGLLNPRQVAEYHHVVFQQFGLPSTAFGGTPFTGSLSEADVFRAIWCGGCDR